MKRMLLFLTLVLGSQLAQAQIEGLVVGGALAGIHALSKGRAQKPDEYVTTVAYGSGTFAQKRTPAEKLKGKGVAEIQAVEQRLQERCLAMRADELQAFFPTSQYNEVLVMLRALAAARPNWNQEPYRLEADFYFHEDMRRDQPRRQRDWQLEQARQARSRARFDSVARVAQRLRERQDSIRETVAARAEQLRDSLDRVAVVAEERTAAVAAGPVVKTRAATGVAGARAASTHKKVAVAPHRAVSRGPVVYYCASGNTVKYHASPDCRGLNRCGSAVVKISQREAEQSMNPCKFCY